MERHLSERLRFSAGSEGMGGRNFLPLPEKRAQGARCRTGAVVTMGGLPLPKGCASARMSPPDRGAACPEAMRGQRGERPFPGGARGEAT